MLEYDAERLLFDPKNRRCLWFTKESHHKVTRQTTLTNKFKHKDVHKKAHTKTCSLIDPPANILNLK